MGATSLSSLYIVLGQPIFVPIGFDYDSHAEPGGSSLRLPGVGVGGHGCGGAERADPSAHGGAYGAPGAVQGGLVCGFGGSLGFFSLGWKQKRKSPMCLRVFVFWSGVGGGRQTQTQASTLQVWVVISIWFMLCLNIVS